MISTWPTFSAAARRRIVAGALLSLLLTLVGCQVTPPVVKIGFVGPFEGRQRPIGYDTIYSARLAIREANGNAPLDGYRVALVALDDSGDQELARQTAAALVADPAVVIVVGHWLDATTAVARPVYDAAALPLIDTAWPALAPRPPETLDDDFRAAYAAITPFDEVAGSHAGPAYDALALALSAIAAAKRDAGAVNRVNVGQALENLSIDAETGQTSPQAAR